MSKHRSKKSAKIEEWRDVVGYEGLYQVSNLGRVKSLDRIVKCPNRWGGIHQLKVSARFMKLVKQPRCGHFTLVLCRGGCIRGASVHKLVMGAFIGPCPEGMEVCHNDGNPGNNHLANLRYDTHRNNQHDMIHHGTSNRGEKHPLAKTTVKDVIRMRKLYATGNYTHAELGVMFKLNRDTVCGIVNRKSWGHVL